MPETVSLKGIEVTADSSVSKEPTRNEVLLAVNYLPPQTPENPEC
jgi:hypothetical protein